MPKDKDGRPILTDSDWKTGEDRKKESPAVTIWGAIWRALLLLGLIAIAGLALIYWTSPEKEGESMPLQLTELIPILGPILGIIGLPLFGYFVYDFYFRGQCPKCKRRGAIEKTGAAKDTGLFDAYDEYEISCKYCSHREWVRVERHTGGGG